MNATNGSTGVGAPQPHKGRVGQSRRAKVRQPRQAASLFEPKILGRAAIDSFKKLDPRVQASNPVMFVVEVGSVVTTVEFAALAAR